MKCLHVPEKRSQCEPKDLWTAPWRLQAWFGGQDVIQGPEWRWGRCASAGWEQHKPRFVWKTWYRREEV